MIDAPTAKLSSHKTSIPDSAIITNEQLEAMMMNLIQILATTERWSAALTTTCPIRCKHTALLLGDGDEHDTMPSVNKQGKLVPMWCACCNTTRIPTLQIVCELHTVSEVGHTAP